MEKQKDYLHYEQKGDQWIWYWHSWTGGKNSAGEGLFIVDLKKNERKQLLGTCQFSLRGLKDPRRAIRRRFD